MIKEFKITYTTTVTWVSDTDEIITSHDKIVMEEHGEIAIRNKGDDNTYGMWISSKHFTATIKTTIN